MLSQQDKYLNVVEEMLDKKMSKINKDTAIEYLYDELQKERKTNEEFYEYFNNAATPNEINELIQCHHKAMSLMTKHYNSLVRENKQLKEQLKQKHCLNSCLFHVITSGGVKEDG